MNDTIFPALALYQGAICDTLRQRVRQSLYVETDQHVATPSIPYSPESVVKYVVDTYHLAYGKFIFAETCLRTLITNLNKLTRVDPILALLAGGLSDPEWRSSSVLLYERMASALLASLTQPRCKQIVQDARFREQRWKQVRDLEHRIFTNSGGVLAAYLPAAIAGVTLFQTDCFSLQRRVLAGKTAIPDVSSLLLAADLFPSQQRLLQQKYEQVEHRFTSSPHLRTLRPPPLALDIFCNRPDVGEFCLKYVDGQFVYAPKANPFGQQDARLGS